MKVPLSCLCLIALFLCVPQAAIAGAAIPKVVVTAAPLQPIVDAILAGITHSSVLARPGQDAHSMLLSPSQARALDAAEIIILPDRALSSSITKLAVRSKKATIISLTDLAGADPLPYELHQAWLKKDDAEIEDNGDMVNDPHIWLDPLRMAAIAPALAEAIAAKAPSLRPTLMANATAWQTHVKRDLHPQLVKLMKLGLPKKRYDSRPFIPFITDHSAYQYFLARYGIDNPGSLALLPESSIGAASKHDVLKRAGEVTIRCVIAEQPTAMVKRVATASNAKVVMLNPELLPLQKNVPALDWLDNDYDRLMYTVAASFRDCL